MSKSAFEKWYQREYVGDSTETFKAEIFHRHARAIALARLRWALRRAKKHHFVADGISMIDPDTIRAEIKKVEAENDSQTS